MRAAALGCMAAVAALAAGCSLARPTPAVRHWVLAVPAAAGAPLAARVRIGTVTADQAYASSRLAIRTSPYRIDYLVYDRWAAPPRELIATVLRDRLERDDGAGAVVEVAGELRRFEGVALAGEDERAELVLALRATRGGAVLVERTYAEREPAASDEPEDLAAALSRAMTRVVGSFREDLRAAAGAG